MRNKIKCTIACLALLGITTGYAQIRIEREGQTIEENEKLSKATDQSLKKFDYKVSRIAVDIQNATVKEKEQLRIRVDSINNLIEANSMTEAEGQVLKAKFAQEASIRIENEATRMQDSLTQAIQNQVNYAMRSGEYLKVADTTKRVATILIGKSFDSQGKEVKLSSEKRTSLRFGLIYGISNVATEGAFANSEMRYIPSNFVQGGIFLKTRLMKNDNAWYLRYGIGWQLSNLKPTGHRYFTVENDETILVHHEKNLTKSRLSVRSIQFPAFLEFDLSKPKVDEKTGKKYFISEDSWRFGIGGFINLVANDSRGNQIYRYNEDGVAYRVDEKGDLGFNKVRYGMGAFVAYGSWGIHFQYEVTPLFKNNSVKQNMWSLGIRTDI
ncbi:MULTISPECIES: hypothetical protein [unclassified Myroides]|uniref:hypothetical protein n=1 Tax=unclassified Myroides TaxID=2642485 RepID=UPI003D2F7A70